MPNRTYTWLRPLCNTANPFLWHTWTRHIFHRCLQEWNVEAREHKPLVLTKSGNWTQIAQPGQPEKKKESIFDSKSASLNKYKNCEWNVKANKCKPLVFGKKWQLDTNCTARPTCKKVDKKSQFLAQKGQVEHIVRGEKMKRKPLVLTIGNKIARFDLA